MNAMNTVERIAMIAVLGLGACAQPVTDDQYIMLLEARLLRIQDPEKLRHQVETAWRDLKSRPIPAVRDSNAIFLYRGPAEEVRLAGDFTNWQPGPRLVKLGHSDIFARALTFPDSARLKYNFIVDGRWMIDSSNTQQSAGALGPCSELRMPRYQARP
jgi:hypothetical protein